MSSHCLICGALIPSGNICHDCRWEMNRIRLKEDVEANLWLSSKLGSKKLILKERKINCSNNL